MSDPRETVPAAGLETGLARSRGGFMARLRGIFGASAFSDADWEAAEEALIAGDVGAILASRVVEGARARRDVESPDAAVRAELGALLAPRDPGWDLRPAVPGHPAIVLIVGVNGTGKTTTIGKLAIQEANAGRRVVLAAADTYRAAANDQLRIWSERAGAAPQVPALRLHRGEVERRRHHGRIGCHAAIVPPGLPRDEIGGDRAGTR